MPFHDIELEIVRPGPAHNQPLNQLTQYLALCGESSPVTFTVDFEHHELLSRLEQLRYFQETESGGFVRVSPRARQTELFKLGQEMGNLLAKMRSLSTELASVRPENWQPKNNDGTSGIVHLRLVLSGSELAILPFELSMAPEATPGEGSELFLQGRLQVVPTRETRRSRPMATRLSDFDHVRVLYAYATPDSNVPHEAHLRSIRAALHPWIGRETRASVDALTTRVDRSDRRRQLKDWIRVLPDASLESITRICSEERFSHVHLLAHGDRFEDSGQTRFGLALCDPSDSSRKQVVSGKQLAHALNVESLDGNHRSGPFWVTLASCDSANPGSFLVPGGSLAHELHVGGIPWVLASQFPLTKSGSVEMARLLYHRLFAGDDPRQALYETRRQLHILSREDHDWASMVTYASVPPDFDDDVAQFFERTTEKAINRVMDSIDKLSSGGADQVLEGERPEELIQAEFARVDDLLKRWQGRVPRGDSAEARRGRTLYHGIRGSVLKRMAIHEARLSAVGLSSDVSGASDIIRLARQKLAEAQQAYRDASDVWAFDGNQFGWAASQYLATTAALGQDLDQELLSILRAGASRSQRSASNEEQAWAWGSEAEAQLLQLEVDLQAAASSDDDQAQIVERAEPPIQDALDKMIRLVTRRSFHVESTERQFRRYAENFGGLAQFTPGFRAVARRMADHMAGEQAPDDGA